jgi:hypothetical protein
VEVFVPVGNKPPTSPLSAIKTDCHTAFCFPVCFALPGWLVALSLALRHTASHLKGRLHRSKTSFLRPQDRECEIIPLLRARCPCNSVLTNCSLQQTRHILIPRSSRRFHSLEFDDSTLSVFPTTSSLLVDISCALAGDVFGIQTMSAVQCFGKKKVGRSSITYTISRGRWERRI